MLPSKKKRVPFTSPSAAQLQNKLCTFKSKLCLVFKHTCPKILLNTKIGLGLNTVVSVQRPKLQCRSGRALPFNILMLTLADPGETYFTRGEFHCCKMVLRHSVCEHVRTDISKTDHFFFFPMHVYYYAYMFVFLFSSVV